ncbi:hypothetical protein BIW11_06309 [Tropilaelaps mercedesae]|uniref:Transmembrane protein n=1 Tax=Tropilaelaps mercedesae TaxID=418985 RepID=A0A1V9XYQ0_9ACAR|nr:hypothetical protein BIW11_06309 [Tropilaelaps mercedesae]
MSRQEDSDDGVMPVALSDSDWERLSYDEDSQPPSLDPDLEAGPGEYEEEDIAPCEEDPLEDEGEPANLTAPFDLDDDASENVISTEPCDSGILVERAGARQSSVPFCSSPSQRTGGTGLLLVLICVIQDFLQPRIQWLFDSALYRKYLADNAMLSSYLVTATVVMCLPLAMALLVSALLVACSAAACVLLVAMLVAVGVVLSLVWAFWVFVPVTILLGALFLGSTIYQKTFRIKLSAKEV